METHRIASSIELESSGRDVGGAQHRRLEVRVRNELGLHLRPAGQLAQEAQKFDAEIKLVSGNHSVDAKSILDIVSLAAGQGSSLAIEADGQDAAAAVEFLAGFFERRCGEDK